MTNKIIVIARIVKDAITYHLMIWLSHSHTFFFRPIPRSAWFSSHAMVHPTNP